MTASSRHVSTAAQAVVPFSYDLALRRFQSREEIVEQRVVNSAALGVILDRKSERIFAQPHLLDDAIVRGPRLHLQVVA